MNRVAFPFRGGAHGIANYFGNLFTALTETPGSNIEPVVITGITDEALPVTWPRVEVIKTRLFERRTMPWLLRGGVQRILGTDLVLQQRLRRRDIAIISHGSPPGRLSTLPTLTWLGDAQHRRLPDFFSAAEIAERDHYFEKASRFADLIIASSEDVRSDLEQFFPSSRGRIRILRFVANAAQSSTLDAGPEHAKEPFVLLPNQFWIHKNHGVVIDALRILKQRGRGIRIVCTGSTTDYRHPDYFAGVMQRVADADVGDLFQVLGLVPYADLANMMRTCVAILNPSLFEGWSTSVEEAKSLGKYVLLSDIPIHREQAPQRGAYFDPGNAEQLADRLWSTVTEFDRAEDRRCMAQARAALPARRAAFAMEYAAIVDECLRTR